VASCWFTRGEVAIGEDPVRAIDIIDEHDPATVSIIGRAYDRSSVSDDQGSDSMSDIDLLRRLR
jgi:hypothetical protein